MADRDVPAGSESCRARMANMSAQENEDEAMVVNQPDMQGVANGADFPTAGRRTARVDRDLRPPRRRCPAGRRRERGGMHGEDDEVRGRTPTPGR